MELSGGVKQGRHRDRILKGQKPFRHARALQVRMAAATRTRHPTITARDRTQYGPWWTFSASRLGDQTQAVALTTKGPNVSVLTHAECSIGAPSLGNPR